MHKLLERQLKRHLEGATPPTALTTLLQAVEQTYQQGDEDRLRVERSLELTSRELLERHRLLEARNAEGRVILDLCPDAICITRRAEIVYVNRAFVDFFGCGSSQEVMGAPLTDFYPPEDRAPLLERINRFYDEGISLVGSLERRLIKRNGTECLAVISMPLKMSFEGAEASLMTYRDVTAQRRAESALKASEAEARMILELCPDPICIRRGLEIAYANQAFVSLFRCSSAAATRGMSVLDFHHPEDRASVRERIARFEGTGTLPETRWVRRMVKFDGSPCEVEISLPKQIAFEGSNAVMVVYRDVTEQRQAEHALRESEKALREMFDSSPLPKYAFERETLRFLAANSAALQLYGYSLEEFLQMRLPDLREDRDVPQPLQAEKPGEKQEWSGVSRHRKKDGTIIEVEIASRSMDMYGRECKVAVARDVSERRRLEEQLRQSQKMEAVGQLAGGVAHDFNNLLSVILSFSSMALNDLKPEDPLRGDMEEIYRAGNRAAALTRQLLAFSRKELPEFKILDVQEVVEGTEKMLQRLIGEDFDLVTLGTPSRTRVRADPRQIEQLLMNLVVNARDAMPKGGTVTVETRCIEADAAFVQGHAGMAPGPYVVLSVKDTGTGMDPATQARIFEPFFTTKGVGKGTGLGLSTVFGIVEQSSGRIAVESAPGLGAKFSVFFPRIAGSKNGPEDEASIPAKGTETILVVEDEEPVRNVAVAILVRQGYRVLTACNAAEALKTCEREGDKVDLVITDVVMPLMSGGELVERLRAARPGVRVLYMSGYNDDAIVQRGVRKEGVPFLQKPITPQSLAAKVRAVLDA